MQTFFSPDSKFMLAMSRVGDLLLLNVLFLISCIPVFTIGAASTALYTVCFRFDTEREQGIVKSYFRAFRENFGQSTFLWLILLLFGASSCVNAMLFYRMSGVIRYVFVLFSALLVLALMIAAYTFPLLSQFSNSSRSTLKNALFLSVGYLPRSLLIVAINVFPFALLILNMYLFFETSFLWISLYFSVAAYIGSLLLKKVFAPYMTGEEAGQ